MSDHQSRHNYRNKWSEGKFENWPLKVIKYIFSIVLAREKQWPYPLLHRLWSESLWAQTCPNPCPRNRKGESPFLWTLMTSMLASHKKPSERFSSLDGSSLSNLVYHLSLRRFLVFLDLEKGGGGVDDNASSRPEVNPLEPASNKVETWREFFILLGNFSLEWTEKLGT